MKKMWGLLLLAALFGCKKEKAVEITITNTSSNLRKELVEIPIESIGDYKNKSFIIKNTQGFQVPYQITYDQKVIFPMTLEAKKEITYTLKEGTPDTFRVLACGRQYPERMDDVAWENGMIAFRTYGPALAATGEKAFGYDVWVKCITDPVVELRYKTELNPETKAKIAELRKTDPEMAKKLTESVSYHIDHGNGLDYYKVGPTLGAGTNALLNADSTIVYPYCYNTYEILDNGPLRFTVKLTYNPLSVNENENIIESRLLSLDAGSQLNKCVITYENLKEPTAVVTGLVMHAPSEEYVANSEIGYTAYAEANDPVNGQTFVGAVFPNAINEAKAVKFSDEEKATRGAEGHVLAYSTYQPGSSYTYYTGAGWSKWGFKTSQDWFDYVRQFAEDLKQPLQVTIK